MTDLFKFTAVLEVLTAVLAPAFVYRVRPYNTALPHSVLVVRQRRQDTEMHPT